MTSARNGSRGFTIVELLIVIVVIGILATLVIVTFTGIQQKARDSKRKTDVAAIQAELESYYGSNNTYPTLVHLNDATWRTANMKGFDAGALQDPTNSATTVIAGTTPTHTQYAYNVIPAGCDDSAGSANPCTDYGIYAKLESDGSVIDKISNN
ncbi:MAG: prepilin-type N-terminal cleavage/methylation domain-containing protein [Candidatus Saccharibacteria bacterium]